MDPRRHRTRRVQIAALGLDFDPYNVPAERFLSGAEAWRLCRTGQLDPTLCGIGEWWGGWSVRNNLIRDLAALNKTELLPWDSWGVMDRQSPIGGQPFDPLLDQVAAAVNADDWPGIRQHYQRDDIPLRQEAGQTGEVDQ